MRGYRLVYQKVMACFESGCQFSVVYGMLPHFSRDSVSLGAWFGFAFLAAVLCELCGKEELNREERQGFAKDAKQVLGQGANCTTT